MNNKSDRVFKLPKGGFKDSFLKYNMLKLLATLVMIFGGLYLIWGSYFGYFSKAPLINETQSIYTNAHVESTESGGYYYYEIVKESLNNEEFNKLKNDTLNQNGITSKSYKETNGKYKLLKPLTKEKYLDIYKIQEKHDLLTKNIFTGEKMPDTVLRGDVFPIIFEIVNPDHHFIGQTGESENNIREFLVKSRERNFLFMFLTPLIPILGLLWLIFSVKHTYKRQQEYEKEIGHN